MDITQLILDDHHEQRRLFSLIDEIEDAEVQSLDAVWGRLATFLEVHAEAEERFFYPSLLKRGEGAGGKDSSEDETEDAIKDHNKIRDAVAAVAACPTGSSEWREAVAKANAENGEHMDEEERQGLTDFRRHAALKLRHGLALQFATFEALHVTGVTPKNKDPQTYIAQNA